MPGGGAGKLSVGLRKGSMPNLAGVIESGGGAGRLSAGPRRGFVTFVPGVGMLGIVSGTAIHDVARMAPTNATVVKCILDLELMFDLRVCDMLFLSILL